MSFRAFGMALLLVSMSAWSANKDDYRAGIEAFKAGRYADARSEFSRAYDAGAREPTLIYNLGAAQFKLGDYPAALVSFERIANDPTWGPLAQYNLGLIDEKLGDSESAQQHYQAAYDTAQSDKLRQLAALKIPEARAAASEDESWFGIVSLGGGYDDNVVLLNDQSLVGVSNEADYFGETLASASGFVQGDIAAGWRADAVGYYRGYRDLSDFDYGTAMLGMTYNQMTPSAHLQIGGRVSTQVVGGDAYTTSGTLRTQVLRPIGAYGFRARNDANYVQGADHFGYLSGWQDRLNVQLDRRVGEYALRVGYELEWNNRRDSTTTTEFFSYSPIWNRIYTEAVRTLSDQFEVEARAEYQFSRYQDDNVETQPDGSTSIAARDDDRVVASLRLTYRAFGAWGVFGEYAYANNSSKFSEYEYTDNQVMVGIERPF